MQRFVIWEFQFTMTLRVRFAKTFYRLRFSWKFFGFAVKLARQFFFILVFLFGRGCCFEKCQTWLLVHCCRVVRFGPVRADCVVILLFWRMKFGIVGLLKFGTKVWFSFWWVCGWWVELVRFLWVCCWWWGGLGFQLVKRGGVKLVGWWEEMRGFRLLYGWCVELVRYILQGVVWVNFRIAWIDGWPGWMAANNSSVKPKQST